MAIRDFGTSLLGNVRARKDAGQAEARKYAKKQENKNIFKTFGLQAAKYVGGEVLASMNAGTTQKTQDFLDNSELQYNKIVVSQFEKELNTVVTDRTAAKDKDMTLTDYYAQDFADKQLANARIEAPEKYLSGNDSFWKASFMKLPEIQEQAKQRAERNELIYTNGNEFVAGRASGRTLETLASRQSTSFPRSVFQRLANNVSTVDSFNDAMGSLTQVKIAKELYDITEDKIKLGREVTAETGNIELGVQAATGLRLNKDQRKVVLDNIAKGYKTTFEHLFQIDGGGNLRHLQVASTVDNDDNVVGTPVLTSKAVGSNKKPTTVPEFNSLIDSTNTTHKNVLALVGAEGYKDFLREATNNNLMPKIMEVKDHVALQIFGMNPNNYTSAKNIIQGLNDAEGQLMAAYIKSSESLLRDIDNPQLNEDERLRKQQQLLTGLSIVLESGRASTKAKKDPKEPTKPVWAPKDSTWSMSLNGWYSNEPNANGKYELYEE